MERKERLSSLWTVWHLDRSPIRDGTCQIQGEEQKKDKKRGERRKEEREGGRREGEGFPLH